MSPEQYLKNLTTPTGIVDVVLDTDAYNEIDDQYAIAYLFKWGDRLKLKGICAAPFFNVKVKSPADGMKKSYEEVLNLLRLMDRCDLEKLVYIGSESYMEDDHTPVISEAARFIARIAEDYTPDHPLYIIAIGAITNIASAMLLNPQIKENCVVVWLGGHGYHMKNNNEFNLRQDITAARIIFNSGVPLIHVPCAGVVDIFRTSRYELEYWLSGKNDLCDYLVRYTTQVAESYAKGKPWTRAIWDVVAVAWLLNDDHRFMDDELVPCPIPEYDHKYSFDDQRHLINYVRKINRDALFADLFDKLAH